MYGKAIVTGVVAALVLAGAGYFVIFKALEAATYSELPVAFSNPQKVPIAGSKKAKLCALTSVGVSSGHICAVYKDEQTGDWIAEASGPTPNGAVCKATCLY
jgi:hypothetical protein